MIKYLHLVYPCIQRQKLVRGTALLATRISLVDHQRGLHNDQGAIPSNSQDYSQKELE